MKLLRSSVLLTVALTACVSTDYDARQDKPATQTGARPIYSVDDHGKLRRDRRMEHVRDRGCVDNSTDCGRPAGW
ncbi:hypothetical protein ACQK5W_12385 [Pantoea sp. FN060301]|uniref:hypothetical protein n=1 Tax=Pantoea sp. FN060301 TaxID=3420380 RepID=UPI003D1765E8